MTQEQFNNWLEKLKIAWETRNPKAAVNLCAEKFIWHETPFSKPLETKNQLLNEWQSVLKQEGISFSYEILSVNEEFGIAKWSATFTRLPSKERFKLDGIFKVYLDENGNCTEFHQWYNSKE